MENQTPTFKKSLSGLSILSIGLGCVVGWSWIIYAGLWGSTPGTLGGVLAFIIAGILCSFIGVVYAELTSIYPRAGGDAVFVFEGLGEIWSVIAGWCTAVLWIGLIFVEVMMIPVILDGLGIFVPQWGPLWNVGGNTVYLSYILISLVINLLFAYINYRGAEISGRVQTASVFILFGAAVFFFVSGISLGSVENAKPFFTDISGLTLIMLMVPSFMSGFNAIPQLAEEANIPPRNTGRAVVLTVWGSVIFYILIIPVSYTHLLIPCKHGAVNLYAALAKAINPAIEATCLHAHPDPRIENVMCRWEFILNDNEKMCIRDRPWED